VFTYIERGGVGVELTRRPLFTNAKPVPVAAPSNGAFMPVVSVVLRRADHSSRGVLPIVVRRCV
jgi:hypothetical protein